jgi:radical SAM superfamily enzyme YgiQ (UPF0313 family)
MPPLGLLTVASMLPKEWEKKLVDQNVTQLKDSDLQWADYIFVSAMVIQRQGVKELIERCHKIGKKIVAGGPLFTAEPENFDEIDYLVLNEAEITLPLFLVDLEKGAPKHFYTSTEKPDLSKTPYPAWELVQRKYYSTMSIQLSRGCPFDCEFCSVTALHGKTYRMRPVSEVEKEIQSLERSKAYIFFVDDNLVGNLSHAKELLTMLSQYRLRWVSQGPIHIAEDDALVKLMARAGCHGLFIGFESLREENLNLMGKRINRVQAYEKGIQKLHEAGIGVYASFVFGYDYDDASVFDEFIAFAEKNRIDGAFLPILTPFPGTRVYQRLKEEGRLLTEDWSQYDMATVVFRPKRMTVEELQEGFWKVNRSFYSIPSMLKRVFNPFQFGRRLIIFGPMNLGLWPAVKKAERYFNRSKGTRL